MSSGKRAETDSGAKLGKENVAGAQEAKMGSHIMVRRLTQGVLRLCSGSAPACSPSTQVYSPSTQVKAAVAHVRRLKQNQRKRKLILSLKVSQAHTTHVSKSTEGILDRTITLHDNSPHI
jgi:hypothetical protein